MLPAVNASSKVAPKLLVRAARSFASALSRIAHVPVATSASSKGTVSTIVDQPVHGRDGSGSHRLRSRRLGRGPATIGTDRNLGPVDGVLVTGRHPPLRHDASAPWASPATCAIRVKSVSFTSGPGAVIGAA
jgi:hypothetical protein